MRASLGVFLPALRGGSWLSRRRVLAYSRILLVLETITFLFFIAGTHGWIVPLNHATTTDFASFYAAGSLADVGTPALAYDQSAHYAAERNATEAGIEYQFFYYPPVYLLLCAILARLPYLVAFIAFELATLALYLRVAHWTLPAQGWAILLPLLAFPSVFWTFGLGQNSFLTAALFGAGLLLVDRRPVAAGLVFGLLCYKPHFGLLIPVALAANGNWRAFAAAACSASLIVALSVLLFGWATWDEFLRLATGSYATYESGRIDFAGFVSPFGAVRLLGGGPGIAYVVQAGVTLAVAAIVAVIWRERLSLPVRAAALAAGTLIAIPVVLVYDLMVASIAALWLVHAGSASGHRPWQKSALAALFIVPLFSRDIGTAFHLPLAPLAALALFILAVDAARFELAQRDPATPPAWFIARIRGLALVRRRA
jgi:alpha-1,2-mannosyltransferase